MAPTTHLAVLQERTKSPLSANMEKGLKSTMEKAGLVQINIWKVKGGSSSYV